MSKFETRHNDYEIAFNENEDAWECRALQLKNVSLDKLKKAITTYQLELRKINKHPALRLESYGREKFTRVNITSIVDAAQGAVWTVSTDKYKSRSKENVGSLLPDVPFTHELIAKAMELDELAAVATKNAQAAWRAIPRIKIDDLTALADQRIDGVV